MRSYESWHWKALHCSAAYCTLCVVWERQLRRDAGKRTREEAHLKVRSRSLSRALSLARALSLSLSRALSLSISCATLDV